MANKLKYTPRNDMVLVKTSKLDTMGGFHVSQSSAAALQFHVVSMGPDVTGLNVGDRVVLMAKKGEGDYYELPREQNLMLISQKFVACRITEEVEVV